MKLFPLEYFNELTERAKIKNRLRQHQNIHQSFQEPCQRLFNAIEPGSYIRPHRHNSSPRDELLVAIRGLMALVIFDNNGTINSVQFLGTERYGPEIFIAAELSSDLWHTVIALESGCVLLEVKAGPFDPSQPKDLAPWAPPEFSSDASRYLKKLTEIVNAGQSK